MKLGSWAQINALLRLELYAVKVARTVLRGGVDREVGSLPDYNNPCDE